MAKAKILFAEDDLNLGFVTKDNLSLAGYEIVHTTDGLATWELYQQSAFDLCILDVMLPSLDGFTLAKKIRTQDQAVPILFLTAKSLQEDKIKGLKLGADDYLTKPFSIEELILRIEVFLRRCYPQIPSTTDTHPLGDFIFHFNTLQLHYLPEDEKQKLTYREGELLHFFLTRKNQLIKREELLEGIWGENDYFLGRSLDVFISRLRKYLAKDQSICIENIHGIGFKLHTEAS
ncbi:MAG: response regulator transcription factor [Bacteroidota bacterium]